MQKFVRRGLGVKGMNTECVPQQGNGKRMEVGVGVESLL
jgi:hypothetical protein